MRADRSRIGKSVLLSPVLQTRDAYMQPTETSFEWVPETSTEIRLSELISAMSYALDITEGQPEGHAVRSCLIGMRIADVLGLSLAERSGLFYGLLLKDLGCSSNAAKMCLLFAADDRTIKRKLKTVNWSKLSDSLRFMHHNMMPEGSPLQRALRTVVLALEGPSAPKKLVQTRCERGAEIARRLGFPELTATAILHLDEHWDGHGQPLGLKGDEISLLGRILGISQTIEVYFSSGGPQAAIDMARERRKTWFDPELVDIFLTLANDSEFWALIGTEDPQRAVASLEPEDQILMANEACIDRVARAFAQVVDAKSPWTFRHSEGVARIAVGMATTLGMPTEDVTRVYRASLLHDIGKLGVSNLILDKPGELTTEELLELRRHPEYSYQILSRVSCFREIAEIAGAHHERLDGRGYYRGLTGSQLTREMRLVAVADICDALSTSRPYRSALPPDEVLKLIRRDAGSALCPECVEALENYELEAARIHRINSQLEEIDRVMSEL
jgi:putative nucleotidyltransferase with HDIG domain